MKKSRRKYFILILLLLVAALLVIASLMLPRAMQNEAMTMETGPAADVGAAGSALALPSVPLAPFAMTTQQKQAAIETARQDAVAAALASGQPDEQAQAAGQAMAEAARRAMRRPSTVDASGR